jgi:hypothetical protein
MRKNWFARKLSLESTYFDDLQDLVAQAIQFARNEGFSEGDDPAACAGKFCALQDDRERERQAAPEERR